MPPALSINDIVEDVASAPGTAIGIEAESMKAIWAATCDSIQASMLNHRSVIFPQFAHFIVQKQQGASGTWGMRTAYIPQIAFLPVFCEAYGIKKPVAMKQAHLGASVPVTLNASVISPAAGQPRHAVNNVLRDLIREVGSRIIERTAVSLDMGFCQIDFRPDGSYTTRWEAEFAEAFSKVAYVPTNQAHAKGAAGGPQPPKRPATARAQLASRTFRASTEGGERPTSARTVPAPPPIPAAPTTENIALHTQQQGLAQDPPSRPASARSTSARSIRSGRGGNTPSISSSSPRRTPTSDLYHASPSVQRTQEIKQAIDSLKTTALTPYQKRVNRKSLYRQLRNKAYEESWEHQIKLKRQIAEEERARDAAKVAAFKDFLLAEEEKERSNAVQKRTEELQVQKMNSNLCSARQPLALPRVVEAGDIFNARQHTTETKPDKTFLATQIELARQRREKERAEDRVFGQNALATAEKYKQERIQAVRQKRQAQLEARDGYIQQIAQRKAADEKYKRELTNGGALLFSGDDDAKAEEEDRRRVLELSRQTQEVNKAVATQRAVEEQNALQQQRLDLKKSQREFAENEHALRVQKKRQDNAVRDALRQSWDSSIEQRRRQQVEGREEMRRWREHNYLRNESSDDDE